MSAERRGRCPNPGCVADSSHMPAKRSPEQSIRIIKSHTSTSARANGVQQEMKIKMFGEMIQRMDGSEDGKQPTSEEKGNDKC